MLRWRPLLDSNPQGTYAAWGSARSPQEQTNRQFDFKGRSFNVVKSKQTGVTTIKVAVASICLGLGRIRRDLFNSLVFAGERALWRKK